MEAELIQIENNGVYTSLYLVDQINIFREQEANKKPLRHADFLRVIEDELEVEILERKISFMYRTIQTGQGANRKVKYYDIPLEYATQLLMRESKFVRRAMIELIKKQQAIIEEQRAQIDDLNSKYAQVLPHLDIKNQRANSTLASKRPLLAGLTLDRARVSAMNWNKLNCKYHSGHFPYYWKVNATKFGVPEHLSTTGKDVVRFLRPAVGAAISMSDYIYGTGAAPMKALELGASIIPLMEYLESVKHLGHSNNPEVKILNV